MESYTLLASHPRSPPFRNPIPTTEYFSFNYTHTVLITTLTFTQFVSQHRSQYDFNHPPATDFQVRRTSPVSYSLFSHLPITALACSSPHANAHHQQGPTGQHPRYHKAGHPPPRASWRRHPHLEGHLHRNSRCHKTVPHGGMLRCIVVRRRHILILRCR